MSQPTDLSTRLHRLAEIRARVKAASVPWKDADDWRHDHNVGYRVARTDEQEEADCELIAHAPSDLAWLCALAEKLIRVAEVADQLDDCLCEFGTDSVGSCSEYGQALGDALAALRNLGEE